MDAYEVTTKLMQQLSSPEEAMELLNKCISESATSSNEIFIKILNLTVDADFIVDTLGKLYEETCKSKDQSGNTKQRNKGIYYTHAELADLLTRETLQRVEKIQYPTLLEPSAGMGAFIFSYLRNVINVEDDHKALPLQEIVNKIYFVDNDPEAIKRLIFLLPQYIRIKYGHQVDISDKNYFVGDAIFDFENQATRNLLSIFQQKNGFEIILTNPPYRLLKAVETDDEDFKDDISRILNISKKSEIFRSIKGVGNLYKFFVAMIVKQWIKKSGTAGLLIPRSLLNDLQSFNLRREILEKFSIGKIYDIPENSLYFKGVGQAFSLFTIKEGVSTKSIDIVIPVDSVKIGDAPVYSSTSIDIYQSITNHIAILPFSQSELAFLAKVENNPKIKEHPQIVNLRGELDMTFDKDFISDSVSKYQFVQGSNISLYELKNLSKFVDPGFFPREKGVWSKETRIACQQISNMNQARRLKWALIPRDHILANSCNFLALDDSSLFKQDRTYFLPYLLAVMNSRFMNYRFKLLSANNHISNTEISNFPLIIPDSNTLQSVKEMADEVVSDIDPNKHLKLEKFLMEIYDLEEFSGFFDSNTRIGSSHAFWSR